MTLRTSLTSYILFILFLSLLFPSASGRSLDRSSSHNIVKRRSDDQKFRLCGNQLVNMLTIVCRVFGNSQRGNERYYSDHSDGTFFFVPLKSARSSRRSRVRDNFGWMTSGLSSSCCSPASHGCSIVELRQAC